MRIFIKTSRVGVCGCRVQVRVKLFDVLPMIALWVCQSKETLLDIRILAVRERSGVAEPALTIRPIQKPVFSPAIGLVTSQVVRKRPRVAIRGIVLPDGTPLAFRKVCPPTLPVGLAADCFGPPLLFDRQALLRILHAVHPSPTLARRLAGESIAGSMISAGSLPKAYVPGCARAQASVLPAARMPAPQ